MAKVQALLLAGLLFGVITAAKAQSTGGGQHIVFSSPDGQITSNAPLPMAQAPESRGRPNFPAGGAATPQFFSPAPPMILPPPMAIQLNNARNHNDQNPMDFRKQFGISTPAEIMNVPSPEELFGLAEKPTDNQKKSARFQSQFAATNDLAPDTTAIIAEPGWAKSWLDGETRKSAQSSNTTEKASGLFGGFFDAARNDNVDNVFANHSAAGSDTLFAQPQTAAQQHSPWSSQLSIGEITPATPAAQPVADNFSAFGSLSSDLTPQSLFTPRQVSSLDALPKLPSLPSASPQNEQFSPPSPSPSWAPKPPPWTQQQTPLGTPAPLDRGR